MLIFVSKPFSLVVVDTLAGFVVVEAVCNEQTHTYQFVVFGSRLKTRALKTTVKC